MEYKTSFWRVCVCIVVHRFVLLAGRSTMFQQAGALCFRFTIKALDSCVACVERKLERNQKCFNLLLPVAFIDNLRDLFRT